MVDFSILRNLSFEHVFVGQGIDELINQIQHDQDYLIALFESTTHQTIWVTDDEEKGHSIFVTDTNGVNKNKLLKVSNRNVKSLFLWHIDGVLFERFSKCDCALLHDKLMHLVEFKVNAKNESDESIEANYEKASNQLALTFEKFEEIYRSHGNDIWSVFDDIDAMMVFDKMVPQDNAYQKKVSAAFVERTTLNLAFGNNIVIV